MIPPAWLPGILNGSLFATTSAPSWLDPEAVLRNGTSVGNGFVASIVDSDTIYIGGVYAVIPDIHNGWRANQSARAKIPSTSTSIDVAESQSSVYALDARGGMYLAQHNISACLSITRRTFAHRRFRSLLVTIFEASNLCNATRNVNLRTTFQNFTHAEIAEFDDFEFKTSENISGTSGAAAFSGTLKRPEMCRRDAVTPPQACSRAVDLAVVHTVTPTALTIGAACGASAAPCRFQFVSSYAVGTGDAAGAMHAAADAYSQALSVGPEALLQSHAQAWAALYDPLQADGGYVRCHGNLDLSRALWSAQYAILSSVRADYLYHGLSPGGLATGGCSARFADWTACSYLGHIFWVGACSFLFVLAHLIHPVYFC
jgi:hypothetical protein